MIKTLTAAALLDVWEQAAGQTPAGRALALAAGLSGLPLMEAAELSVGDRDRQLIAAHRGLFGRQVEARADCPQCGEQLELELDLAEFDGEPEAAVEAIAVEGCVVEWRAPTAGDLVAVSQRRTPGAARTELIRRCVTRVARAGEPIEAGDWPAGVVSAVARAAEADPLADPRVALACVKCGHDWHAALDVAAFLWIEIDVLAQRLVDEVHRLAAMYGWSEAAILAMSATRRAIYLRMCGS
jgi:hypothetical protein